MSDVIAAIYADTTRAHAPLPEHRLERRLQMIELRCQYLEEQVTRLTRAMAQDKEEA